ncbi:amidase [Dongia sp.]|uniref:amidase n=1 Tax=Dongia sp. TaxID=1977262 RepID=UPI0035B2B226
MKAVETSLAKIAKDNHLFRAITHLDSQNAGARAAAVDAAQPLHGLTFVAKDQIDVAGLPTSFGSRLFPDQPATRDAACIQALQAAGAVVIGKANMHELAVGSARNPWFGQVVNPLSSKHGTGGTSSGSAAAVAAGFCDFALGTDSGGSIRSVAAAVGVYGFKPTNGVLSLDGVWQVAPTLDTLGLLARDGGTLAKAFAALGGETADRSATLAGKVIAHPIGLYGDVDVVVEEAMNRALDAIRSGGGRVVEVKIEDSAALAEAGRTILRYEFALAYSENVAANPARVSPEVLAFAHTANKVSCAAYDAAKSLILDHRAVWHDLLRGIDALLAPVAPGLAPRLIDEHTEVNGQWQPYGPAGAEFRMWANTIGIPAVAIPVQCAGRLPAAIQLAARPHADGALIDLSAALGREIENQRAAKSQ